MTFLDPDILSDETAVAEAILAGIADRIPDWEPSEGHIETAAGESIGVVLATIAALVKSEARDSYSGFGEAILKTPRQAAAVATALSRWTVTEISALARIIPDGSEFVLDAADGTPYAFATVGGVTVAPGALTAEDVLAIALEPGPGPNGLVGAARDFESLTWISAVTLTTAASAGADPEPLLDYVARLAAKARRIRDLPIVADDFAVRALDHPSVFRCTARNLLDYNFPYAPIPGVGGHVTIFPVDEAGAAPGGQVPDELIEMMRPADRPLNITVHVGDPQVTDLAIVIAVRLDADVDPVPALAAVEAAIRATYNKATWGLDETLDWKWRSRPEDQTITAFDVSHVANTVFGVVGVGTCTINGGASVTLAGYAPLPNITTCTVTVAP
jgi:hypothetical protein